MSGKPWERYGSGQGGTVFTVPVDPRQQDADARAAAADARAADAERRAQDDQRRQKEKEERDKRDYKNTHTSDGRPLQNVSDTSVNAILSNVQQIREIDNAIRLLESRPNSIGFGTSMIPVVGDNFTDWRDPDGVAARAALAKIGALQFHEISGAAINASEAPRLKPYIPGIGNNPQSALEKLRQLRASFADQTKSQINSFTPQNGYYQFNLPSEDAKALTGQPPQAVKQEQAVGTSGYGGGGDTIGEDPRYKGQRFNDSGQPDPSGSYDAYGRAYPEEIMGYNGPKNPDGSWTDEAGRVHTSNGSGGYNITSGWKGPGQGSYQQYLQGKLKESGFDPSLSASGNERFNNGTLATFGDELAGAGGYLGGLISGKNPSTMSALMRDMELTKQQQMRDKQGAIGTGLELAGNLIPASLLPGGSGIGGAARQGAMYGALDGAGRGNSLSGRLLNAGGGAAGGALGGTVGGVVGKYAVAPAARRLMNTGIGQQIAGKVGMQPVPNPTPLESQFSKAGVNMGNVRSNIADAEGLGLPYALSDADPRLQILAGQVARSSPETASTARQFLEPRSLGQFDRLRDAVDTHLAPVTDIAQRGGQLTQAGNTAASPYYQLAKGKAAPIDEELQAMLQTPAGRDALARAREIAQNGGKNPEGIGFDLNAQGEPMLVSKPSFEALDLVKRGFDGRIEGARNQVTGKLDLTGDPQLKAINDLRGRFVGKLDTLNPNYPKARAEYARYAKMREALDTGNKLPQMLPRDAQTFTSRLTPDQLPEAQRGFATALVDQAQKMRYTADPYKGIFGSPAQQERVASMFPQGADTFKRLFNREGDMAATAHEVLGGSQTAMRQGMDGAFGSNLTGPLEVLGSASGIPGAATAATQGVKWGLRKGGAKLKQQMAEKLAPALFNDTQSIGALGLLDSMIKNELRRTTATNKAIRKAGLFGATLVPTTVN